MTTARNVRVVIEDQGPRDGFQVEASCVPTELKRSFIEGLAEAGLSRIQVCSFVSPRAVPQMADADDLCRSLEARAGVTYSGLVLNEKGIERAIAARLTHVACSYSASDTHSRKNTRMTRSEAQADFARTVARAKQAGMTVRGGLQCAFGCRYEGAIDPARVLASVEHQLSLGVDELALADSTGMAHPATITALMERVVPMAAGRPVFLHLHDTEGRAMVNALAALDCGVRHFDTAFAGMGGCPYIAGASGNLSTEDLCTTLHGLGYETGIDVRKVATLSLRAEAFFGKAFFGRMHRVLSNEASRRTP